MIDAIVRQVAFPVLAKKKYALCNSCNGIFDGTAGRCCQRVSLALQTIKRSACSLRARRCTRRGVLRSQI
jgi:hypothetical protein